MDEKGQLMDIPIRLVMALVIGMLCMGVLVQFVGTAERTVIKDLDVQLDTRSYSSTKKRLTVEVNDASSGDPVGGATVQVTYSGGSDAKTNSSNSFTFLHPLGRPDSGVSDGVGASGRMGSAPGVGTRSHTRWRCDRRGPSRHPQFGADLTGTGGAG